MRCRRRWPSSPRGPSSSADGRPSNARSVLIRVPRRRSVAVGSVRRDGEQVRDAAGRANDRPARCRHTSLLRQPLLGLSGPRSWAVAPRRGGVAARSRPAVAVSAGGAVIVFTASYVAACAMVAGVRPSGGTILAAMTVGIVVYLPAPFLFLAFVLPGIAWFALFGWRCPPPWRSGSESSTPCAGGSSGVGRLRPCAWQHSARWGCSSSSPAR